MAIQAAAIFFFHIFFFFFGGRKILYIFWKKKMKKMEKKVSSRTFFSHSAASPETIIFMDILSHTTSDLIHTRFTLTGGRGLVRQLGVRGPRQYPTPDGPTRLHAAPRTGHRTHHGTGQELRPADHRQETRHQVSALSTGSPRRWENLENENGHRKVMEHEKVRETNKKSVPSVRFEPQPF